MLFWIAIVGGLTLMMGQHTRSDSLFYYFRLEDHVPENHLLRLVDSTLTPQVRQVLGSFGFDSFTVTDEGFRAVRPLPASLRC
jgi:hypothetical protein